MNLDEFKERIFWINFSIRNSGNTTTLLKLSLRKPTVIICADGNSCWMFNKKFNEMYLKKFWLRLRINGLLQGLGINIKDPVKPMIVNLWHLMENGDQSNILLKTIGSVVRNQNRVVLFDNYCFDLFSKYAFESIAIEVDRKLETAREEIKELKNNINKMSAALPQVSEDMMVNKNYLKDLKRFG